MPRAGAHTADAQEEASVQDGPDHGTRRSRRTRTSDGRTPPEDTSGAARTADDDPLFGPLPDPDPDPTDPPQDRAGERGRAPGTSGGSPDSSPEAAPRADREGRRRRADRGPDRGAEKTGRDPSGTGRRRDSSAGAAPQGPVQPDAAAPGAGSPGPVPPGPARPQAGPARAPGRPADPAADARRAPAPPPTGRPRAAERTDALPSVTPRTDGAPGPAGPAAAPGRPDAPSAGSRHTGGTPRPADPPRPAGSEPAPPRRRRSRVDARATEVIAAIMPRRRARQERDAVPPAPEPPTGAAPQAPAAPPPAPEDPGTPPPPQSDPAPPAEAEENVAPPRRGTAGMRIAAAALAALVLVTTAAGFSARNTVEDGIVDVPALDPTSDAISSRAAQAGDENVLVLGLAADRLREPEAARTDTAVVVHVPAGGGPAVTLSMPATLEVSRPPCRRWDPASATYTGSVPAESRTTLSSVYDVGGPACTVGAVQQLTGLALTRFVALDVAGAESLVTAVRGVEVCTERPVVDRSLGPIVTSAGTATLTADEAVRFAGAASVVEDTSPANRIQRQQRVLAAAMDRALSMPSLLTPGMPTRVSQALSRSVLTDNADSGEVLTLARSLSRAGTAGDGSTATFLPVPVREEPNTRGHLELERSDAEDLFSAMRKHEPLPEEITAPAQRAAARALPQGVSIDVVNAAGKAGIAGQVADSLRAQGFRVGTVSNAPESPQTIVRFSPDRAELARRLASNLAGAVPAPDPTKASSLQLVLGSGFSGPVTLPPQQPSEDAVECG